MTIKKNKTIPYIVKFLAPLKILVLAGVIVFGIYTGQPLLAHSTNLLAEVKTSLTYGYNTMDLLAGIFFSGLIYAYIERELKKSHAYTHKKVLKICIYASIMGWGTTAVP